MQKNIYLLIFIFCSISFFGQTDGLTYQAVILDDNALELPGQDLAENYLSNGEITLKFTIYDHLNTVVYQEVQLTTTDVFGLINVVIGQGEKIGGIVSFNEIDWDGNPKDLGVEISYEADNFQDLTRQALYFIPYAFHRNITATGTLTVDGATLLNADLTVVQDADFMGHSQFNTITVLNESDLQGTLDVQEITHLHSELTTEGDAHFQSNLNVLLNANVSQNLSTGIDLSVGNNALINNDLYVGNNSLLNGQVRISADIPNGVQDNFYDHPLQVDGGAHGIAIKVNVASPGRNTNFITFFNGSETPVGRIEGFAGLEEIAEGIIDAIIEAAEDIGDDVDPDDEDSDVPPADLPPSLTNSLVNNYYIGAIDHQLDISSATITFATNLTASLGLCISGDCDDPIWAAVDLVIQIVQYEIYLIYNELNLGVAFESGGADYAEWLQKINENEILNFGDVVGVKGGLISKNMSNPENYMVVSKNPTVIGAMPEAGLEDNYAKIAFMGQVPVKTIGTVNLSDYILPSGNNDGLAIAVSPENMKANDYKRIIGVAWSESKGEALFSYINTAVGLNANDMSGMIESMQSVMNEMQLILAELKPNYTPKLFNVETEADMNQDLITVSPQVNEILAAQLDLKENMKRKEAFSKIKNYALENGARLSRYPYLEEVLDNPNDKALVEKMSVHYMNVHQAFIKHVKRIKELKARQ